MAPTVSVVIPTRNRKTLLPVALRSALAQTFPDVEILVVDDASTDGTAELYRDFPDPRIQWLRHDVARGGAAARNTGIVHSRGEYIAFLDDDDAWYPEKLARQMEVMLTSPPNVAAVYTGYVIVDRASGQVRGRMVPHRRGDLQADLMKSNPIGGTSSMLLRRSCLDQVGLFDEALPSLQDRDLWIRIARRFHFAYVPEPLLTYFLHSPRVWSNVEALLGGLTIMLGKYGSSPAFRRYCSKRYLECGIRLAQAGETARGRAAVVKSITLHPSGLRAYLYLALTLFGPRALTMARDTKAKIVGAPSTTP
jgi:glycosyltransferase involved in cell wall biosynthesis